MSQAQDEMARSEVSVSAVRADDADRVSLFLHTHLNRRVPAAAWTALIHPPWGAVGPNHGYQLLDGNNQTVGVYLAVYSMRESGRRAVCNLAAFFVVEAHRTQSLRLIRALLGQKGYVFTDLSPSGNVPAMNERLGFRRLNTATRLVLNAPDAARGVTVTDSRAILAEILVGRDADVYRDHLRAPAARHALMLHGDCYAYLMYRRDRRKRLPLFASPLYGGGDGDLLEGSWPAVGAHLLRRGLAATLAEKRVLGFTPRGIGRELVAPRVKMYRGDAGEGDIDYLYSELTLLQW
jgi:hypothetical protein